MESTQFDSSAAGQSHHYIPKCYLKRFSNEEDKLRVKKTKSGEVIHPSVNSIFKEKGLYDLSDWEADVDVPADGTERMFSNTLEPIFEKIMSEKVDKNLLPKRNEAEGVALFCFGVYVRNPSHKSRWKKLCEKGKLEEVEKSVESFGVVTLRNIVYHYPEVFSDKENIHFVRAPDGKKFISSDKPSLPCIYKDEYKIGIIDDIFAYKNILSRQWNKKYGIMCPLSPKYMVMVRPTLEREGVTHEMVTSTQVDQLNHIVRSQAERFIVENQQ